MTAVTLVEAANNLVHGVFQVSGSSNSYFFCMGSGGYQ